MTGRMRTRMGRLGVVMTFFALLFAMMPSLEAMACAAEGCDPACAERVVEASQAGDQATDPASDDCAGNECLCITGHCSHSAVSVQEVGANFVPIVHRTSAPIATEHPVAAAPITPERPPRI